MSEFSFTLHVPALDRLCDLLERRADIPASIADPAPAPTVKELETAVKQADAAPSQPEPEAPAAPEQPAPAVSLEDLQRAAAELRDAGKLQAVTALFPVYSVRKLSDLKPDQMNGFADELRRLGAKI